MAACEAGKVERGILNLVTGPVFTGVSGHVGHIPGHIGLPPRHLGPARRVLRGRILAARWGHRGQSRPISFEVGSQIFATKSFGPSRWYYGGL